MFPCCIRPQDLKQENNAQHAADRNQTGNSLGGHEAQFHRVT